MTIKKRQVVAVVILAMIMVLGFATLCMASEAAGGAQSALHQPAGKPPLFPNLYVIGWSLVNFLILLSLIYKFGYGPINSMLEQRTTTIESSLKHAEEVKAEVEEMRKETQANLADSRREAQEIVARATKAADDAKNEIIGKAKEDASGIKNKATAEIAAATEAAKAELKDTAASLAMFAAEKVLGRAITEDDHKTMVKQFVNEAGDLLC
ncbi:MAG: F0F1 ATP synthase subunit B [Syntrophomonas sp.]